MAQPTAKQPSRLMYAFVAALTRTQIFWYRHTGGRVFGKLMGVPCLILTTIGRKTGKTRYSVLSEIHDGERLVLIASNGGAPKQPTWYLNLLAHPEAEVQIGARHLRVRAAVAPPEDRERLWQLANATMKDYAVYQTRTTRQIPVVVLEPIGDSAA
jgi:deazaflavin-dependent oxidoreductase (nitroreductase family)